MLGMRGACKYANITLHIIVELPRKFQACVWKINVIILYGKHCNTEYSPREILSTCACGLYTTLYSLKKIRRCSGVFCIHTFYVWMNFTYFYYAIYKYIIYIKKIVYVKVILNETPPRSLFNILMARCYIVYIYYIVYTYRDYIPAVTIIIVCIAFYYHRVIVCTRLNK